MFICRGNNAKLPYNGNPGRSTEQYPGLNIPSFKIDYLQVG